jgi:hypothetical protein
MAKEKRAGEALSNLDWDSPPNNRFKPWPIEPKSRTDGSQGAPKVQRRSDGAHEQTCDSTRGQQKG